MSSSNPHKIVDLGTTGLRVSNLCFGTSAIGDMPDTYGYGVDEERAASTIGAMLDGPVNFLDTSRAYGHGNSEARIGNVIRARGGLPDGYIISSKLDRDLNSNQFDADRARRSLDESLTALGVDSIPLLHLHDPEHAASLEDITRPDGAIAELFKMKEEGLVQAVGLAAGRVDIMTPMLRDWDFDALITHNRFTLTNRNADDMIDLAFSKGTAVLNAAPYNGGIYAKGSANYKRYAYQPADDETLASVRRIEAICAANHVPTGALALQFSIRDPRVTSTILGISKPERIQQTIDWANWPIGDDVWEEIDALPTSRDDPEANRDYKSS
jgi:D-threo-aldose 1-dehydrogenase